LAPFTTLNDVVEGLGSLEASYLGRRDRRAIFLTVYGLMSREMKRRIAEKQFDDNDWVTRYTVCFANYYRDALDGYARRQRIPKSWQIACSATQEPTGLVLQDVLLGIRAHRSPARTAPAGGRVFRAGASGLAPIHCADTDRGARCPRAAWRRSRRSF
jgi:hypothetical protein